MTATTKEEQAQVTATEFPFEPMEDIVVVEQLKEEKSAGGILLTASKLSTYPCGRVIAVGPGRVFTSYIDASGHHQAGQFIPTRVKVGDWVIWGKYTSGGEPIEWEGRKFVMCREGDLGLKTKDGSAHKVRRAEIEQ